jgi:hypothetical protein
MVDDAFAPHTGIRWNGTTGVVEYGGGDRGMVCFFYNKAVPNPAKAAQEGRPVHENKVFVRIAPPGERLNIVEREATENDKMRFPMQWEQFRKNKQQVIEGTPIELLYPDQPAIAATLRGNGVQTVEMCADLSAHAIENVGMGCQTWVNYAKRYIEASRKGANESAHRREIEQIQRENKTLKSQIKMLKDQLDNVMQRQAQAPDLSTVQAMLAGLMQRPQHMPQQGFDSQTALINAQGRELRAPRKRERPRSRG